MLLLLILKFDLFWLLKLNKFVLDAPNSKFEFKLELLLLFPNKLLFAWLLLLNKLFGFPWFIFEKILGELELLNPWLFPNKDIGIVLFEEKFWFWNKDIL